MAEETTNGITKLIIGTALTAVLSVAGVTGDYYLDKDVPIYTEVITDYEYDELKPQISDIMSNSKMKELTYQELAIWSDVLNKEMSQCGKVQFSHITNSDDLIDKLNEVILKGC